MMTFVCTGIPISSEERLFSKILQILKIVAFTSVNINCTCVVYIKTLVVTNFWINVNYV